MQPTPVEVHKYAAPWNDLASPTSPDIDDVPSPAAVAGLSLPLALLADHPANTLATHHHQLTGLSSSESFADSFDDDTVVSFDDLSEVVTSTSAAQHYMASAPPPVSPAHHTAAEFSAALEGPF